MPLSTEVFVMIIFISGLPFFYALLRDCDLEGRLYFGTGYILLTLSNIFTVIEEFWLYAFFNASEHACIAGGAFMMFIAILKMVKACRDKRRNIT